MVIIYLKQMKKMHHSIFIDFIAVKVKPFKLFKFWQDRIQF